MFKSVEFSVLGALEVSSRGSRLPIDSAKQRALLSLLLIHSNQVVSTDRILDALWGEDQPESGIKTVRFHVSKLRDALRFDDETTDGPISTRPPGYLVDVPPTAVDASQFEAAVAEARTLIKSDPAEAVSRLQEALGLWRGKAYDEFQYEDWAAAEATRLDESRVAAVEDRIDAELGLGRHFELTAELEALVAEHPFRERMTAMWMLALYRSGRQRDALRAFQLLRQRLVDELGADPTPEVMALEQRMLEQDESLDARIESKPMGVARSVRGYELRELIGSGNLGVVHRAYQPAVGREVAIKVIGPELANDAAFIQRFDIDAQQVAKLDHPHIASTYDYWRESGSAYLVSRWIRGGNLEDALQRGAWTLEHAMTLLEQVGSALVYAHRLGMIHRDIKASNVLLDDDGTPYLADFGNAPLRDAGLGPAGRVSPSSAAPEQLAGGAVGPWTDVYQLALLAFQVFTGRRPYDAAVWERRFELPLPLVQDFVPELPDRVNTVLARGTSALVDDRYGDVDTFIAELRKAVGGQEPAVVVATRNPYKGLHAFDESDAAVFFGRSTLVDALVKRLSATDEGSRFLAIVGPSGSGKSSVARAGLIPALRRGAVPGSDRWFIADMVPGADPMAELVKALAGITSRSPEDVEVRVGRNGQGIHDAVRRSLPDESWELFLLIDQFEEVFVRGVPDERARFIDGLVTAINHPRSQLRVVVTLRADFYDRPLVYSELGELMRRRTETILPLTAAEMEEAIVRPAKEAGVVIEPGVVGQVLGDVVEQPGALPLVQYAMTELYEWSKGGAMTLDGYTAIGGVSGALTQSADAVLADLSVRGRDAACRLFLEMVELGEGAEDTRRRVRLTELSRLGDEAAMVDAIGRFGDARLLQFDRDPVTRSPTVEVAHEALLREWGQLRSWIEEGRDDLRTVRRLEQQAAEWERSGRDTSFLLSGTRLAAVDDVADPSVDDFLIESRHARARSRRRKRVGVIALAVLTGLFAVAALFAVRGQRQANRSAVEALASGSLALIDSDPGLAVALALEADGRGSTVETQGAVLSALDAFTGRRGLHTATLSAFKGSVWSVAYTPDGSSLIGANDGLKGVQLWDVQSREPGRAFEDWHGQSLREIALTSDGRLVTTSLDRTAKVWDLASGAEMAVMEGHEDQVWAVDVFAASNRAATGSRDGTARLWDLATGAELAVFDTKVSARQSLSFPDSRMDVWSVRFSPDGSRLATSGEDGMVRIWDVASGQELVAVQAHTAPGQDLAYSPDGNTLYSAGDDGIVIIIDAESGDIVGRLSHGSGLRSLDLNADGTWLVTGNVDGEAVLWDLASGERLAVMRGHDGLVNDVTFDPTGRQITTAGSDGTIQIWDTDLSSGAVVLEGHGDGQGAGRRSRIHSLAFSPDGSQLVTGSADYTTRLWNWSTGEALDVLIGPEDQVGNVAFSPDGQTVAAGTSEGLVWLWDADSGNLIDKLQLPDRARGLAFTADGSRLVAGSFGDVTTIWDLDGGRRIGDLPAHAEGTRQLAVSPGGIVARAGGDFATTLWDLDTGMLLGELKGHQGEVRMVVFSPDESLIATSSSDGTIMLWDAVSYETLATLSGHVAGIRGLAFSPDGRLLASSSEDSTARIWDVESRSLLATWRRQAGDVSAVAFSPDGDWLASASADGTVLVRYAGSDTDRICGWLQHYVSRTALVEALGGEAPSVCTNLEALPAD